MLGPTKLTDRQAYSAAASFVPEQTHKLLQYLDPHHRDRVVDLGCGDAKFTAHFINHVSEVYGLDASPSLIASARQAYPSPRLRFNVVDCRFLEADAEFVDGEWDKM